MEKINKMQQVGHIIFIDANFNSIWFSYSIGRKKNSKKFESEKSV